MLESKRTRHWLDRPWYASAVFLHVLDALFWLLLASAASLGVFSIVYGLSL